MWVLDELLRRLVKRGRLIVVDYDGKKYQYGAPDKVFPCPIRIRLTDRRVAASIVRDPRVGVGEGYMDGRLVVEKGDIRDLAALASYNAPLGLERRLNHKGSLRELMDVVAGKLDQVNWKQRSRRNAEHTYNLTRQLYELFLDEDRQYTCAYYRNPFNSLEQAQLDKKAHIAAKLDLKPGMRVLDIGCGWGGMALYLQRHYDVEVLGIALAPDQIEFSRERAAGAGVSHRVQFELMDYRDAPGRFDRIVNVGLIEHLGSPHHAGFYAKCHDLLEPDGVMVSHCCGQVWGRSITDKWTRKYIFPGGHIPTLSELVSQAERHKLIVADVETLRYHYADTLHEWYKRTCAARQAIIELYDERFFRMWQFYLAGAEAGFRHGALVNFQVQYVKRRDAVPVTRDYMFDEEARLRTSEAAPAWRLAGDRQAAE